MEDLVLPDMLNHFATSSDSMQSCIIISSNVKSVFCKEIRGFYAIFVGITLNGEYIWIYFTYIDHNQVHYEPQEYCSNNNFGSLLLPSF